MITCPTCKRIIEDDMEHCPFCGPTKKPQRIQRKRTKGWRMPPNTISVTRPGPFGNPFRVGDSYIPNQPVLHYDDLVYRTVETAQQAVNLFRDFAEREWTGGLYLSELRDKDLACWCPIISHNIYCPCHADVLISIANDMTMEEVINENLRRSKRETAG